MGATLLYSYVGPLVGNGADLTEDVLLSYTLPANTLTQDGQVIHIIAGGTAADSADLKYARIDLGGVRSLIAATLNEVNAIFWTLETWITRDGPNGLIRIGREVSQEILPVGTLKGATTVPVDWTSDTVFTVTGQNAANSVAGSVAAGGMIVMLWQ